MRSTWARALMFLVLTISMLATVACNTSNNQGNTATTSSQVTTTIPSTLTGGNTTSSSTKTTQAPKVLKIGFVYDFTTPPSIDSAKAIDALVDRDNQNGGWNIGGEKYQVKLVAYDAGVSDQATETAAINRLISQDNVKYILDMGNLSITDLPITEANKVMNFNMSMAASVVLAPNNNYSYGASGADIGTAAFWGWANKYYSLTDKKVVGAFSDNMVGHIIAESTDVNAKAYGVNMEMVFYPAGAQDFSAVATKVLSMNPDFFTTMSGNDANDGLVYNSVRQAGFKGQLFSQTPNSTQFLANILQPDALNGFVCRANAADFTPPLTQGAEDLISVWTAKYGRWTNPLLTNLSPYFMLKAALEQAGSLDVDKVAAVLNNGMKFENIDGPAVMFARTDLGNDRTTDGAFTQYFKTIENGQSKLLATLSAEEAISNFRIGFPPFPPGATPPAPSGPPPGAPPGPPPG